MTSPAETRALVLEAFDALFNRRDYEAAARLWSPDYIQHSAHIAPGRDGLFNLVKAAPAELRYENAVAVADGEYVLLHGRFTGNGRPRAWIAADIVRVAGGILVEHWDVLQDEATRDESKSGLPMFGARFPAAGDAAPPAPLTVEAAKRIVAPLYDALNQPQTKDVAALLAHACHADYRSYSTNEDWLTRDQLAGVFQQLGAAVPDLSWRSRTSGRQAIASSCAGRRPAPRWPTCSARRPPDGASRRWRSMCSPYEVTSSHPRITSRTGSARCSRSGRALDSGSSGCLAAVATRAARYDSPGHRARADPGHWSPGGTRGVQADVARGVEQPEGRTPRLVLSRRRMDCHCISRCGFELASSCRGGW